MINKLYRKVFGRSHYGMRVRYAIIHKHIPKNRKTLLDVGCGEGYFSSKLSNHFDKVVGVDITDERFKRTPNNVKLMEADAKKLPFKAGTFDVAISSDVLEHDLGYDKIIKEVARVTKKGGFFLITVPHPSFPNGPAHVVKGFTIKKLDESLSRHGFKIVRSDYYFRALGWFLYKIDASLKSKAIKGILFPVIYPLSKLDCLFPNKGRGVFVKAIRL